MNGKQLKNSILQWAIQGKLVPQDANEEPAIELLKRLNPKIKPITEDEPFEVPESWVWCRLKDICIFLSRGRSPKYSEEKKYPVFAQKCNLKYGWISLAEARFLDPSTLSQWREEYKLKTGDVLINSTGTGTVCRTRLFDEKCLGDYPFVVPDSHVSVVRTVDDVNSKFILYYISSSLTQQYLEDNLAGSTNQKELYIGVLENLLIPLPPFAEQKRIVEKIEELMPLVERYTKAQEGLDKLNAGIKGKLRASILQEAIQGKLVPQDANDESAITLLKRINSSFTPPQYEEPLPHGWTWCKASNLGTYGMGQTILTREMIDKGIPVYSATIDDSPLGYIRQENNNVKLTRGDLVIPARGNSIGYVTYVKDNEAACTQTTIYVKVTDKALSPFLYYYFLACKNTIFRYSGSAIPQITIRMIFNHFIPLPPLAEQKRIVAKIEALFGVLGRL